MADKKPKRSWWRIVFILSVGLNLLFVGIVAGSAFRIKGWSEYGGGRQGFTAGSAYIRALDHDSKHELISVMRGFRHNRGETRHLEHYRNVIDLLRQDAVDEAALLDAMNGHAGLSLARLEGALKAMVSHLAGLDAERRKAYADRLEDAIENPPRRRR